MQRRQVAFVRWVRAWSYTSWNNFWWEGRLRATVAGFCAHNEVGESERAFSCMQDGWHIYSGGWWSDSWLLTFRIVSFSLCLFTRGKDKVIGGYFCQVTMQCHSHITQAHQREYSMKSYTLLRSVGGVRVSQVIGVFSSGRGNTLTGRWRSLWLQGATANTLILMIDKLFSTLLTSPPARPHGRIQGSVCHWHTLLFLHQGNWWIWNKMHI